MESWRIGIMGLKELFDNLSSFIPLLSPMFHSSGIPLFHADDTNSLPLKNL
jgi:hypothetical protein